MREYKKEKTKEVRINRFLYLYHVKYLRPRVIVEYEREPYIHPDGDVRITIDRNISFNFPELADVFKRLGLDDEISGYFLFASIGYEKPRKEIFEYAILKAGNPEIKYMIGDNPIADYQGGLNAGMIPVLVHNTAEGAMCCAQLTDLMDVIKE